MKPSFSAEFKIWSSCGESNPRLDGRLVEDDVIGDDVGGDDVDVAEFHVWTSEPDIFIHFGRLSFGEKLVRCLSYLFVFLLLTIA